MAYLTGAVDGIKKMRECRAGRVSGFIETPPYGVTAVSYTHLKSHEWVKAVEDTTVVVGLTDYAQDALGDLVFVNLPELAVLLHDSV